MKAVDTANERPDEALSFAVSTTFIRFSVDEWHVLKVGCLRGGGVFGVEVSSGWRCLRGGGGVSKEVPYMYQYDPN